MGLHDTTFHPTAAMGPRLAEGHDAALKPIPPLGIFNAAGGLRSTPQDLAHFAAAILPGSGARIAPDELLAVRRPAPWIGGCRPWGGKYWMPREARCRTQNAVRPVAARTHSSPRQRLANQGHPSTACHPAPYPTQRSQCEPTPAPTPATCIARRSTRLPTSAQTWWKVTGVRPRGCPGTRTNRHSASRPASAPIRRQTKHHAWQDSAAS